MNALLTVTRTLAYRCAKITSRFNDAHWRKVQDARAERDRRLSPAPLSVPILPSVNPRSRARAISALVTRFG